MKSNSTVKISKQRQRKIFGTLNYSITHKLDKMISNNELSFYEFISTMLNKNHMSVIYLLYMENQFVERLIGTYSLKTGSITYASSLSKDLHTRYIGKWPKK